MGFIVYKHTSPSGKVYIGITQQENPKRRWCGGHGYHKNDYFRRAIERHGWENFKHEILYDGLTQEEAEQKEIELIAKYKSNDPKYGYNLDNGGSYAGKHSEQTRKKISKTLTGRKMPEEVKKKLSVVRKKYFQEHGHHCLGKKQSKELVDKRTKAWLSTLPYHKKHYNVGSQNFMWGKHHTEESNRKNMLSQPNRKEVVQIDKNTGEIITVWDSVKQAATAIGAASGNICRACKETHRVVKGYKWRYKYEYEKEEAA